MSADRDDFLFMYVPLDRFLIYLLGGWQFPSWIAEPMSMPHGEYSVFLIKCDQNDDREELQIDR